MSDRKIGMVDQKRSFAAMALAAISAACFWRARAVEVPKLETAPEHEHRRRFSRSCGPRARFGGGTPERNLQVYEVEEKFLPYGMRRHRRASKKPWPFKRKAVAV